MRLNRLVTACGLACVLCVLAAAPILAQDTPPFIFKDVAQSRGLHEPLRGMMGHAAAWGDVDGDGRIDLFVGTYTDRPAADYIAGGADGPVPNRLLMNRGDRFELADQPVLAWHGRASGVVLADLDNDGLPDLYVANNGRKGHQNQLYHNKGDGRFENINERAGAPVHLPEVARGAAVLDYDGDGLLDLLTLGSIKQEGTMLLRNRGGMKFERSDAIPADAVGLGLAVGDVTGNGWPDVMIGGPNRLFVNRGDGTFREAKELGLDWGFTREDDSPSCGVAFGDIDRDGDLDMLIGSHHKAPWGKPTPIRLFRNLGSTTQRVRFEEITDKAGIVSYPMKLPHVEIRDFDNDGRPDLYTAAAVFMDGQVFPAIYRNLGVGDDGLPRFQETAFVHRPDYPTPGDYEPNERSSSFYEKLVANRKVMYYAPGPSADFDNDGRLDLFMCSWWPKASSLLLRNETRAGHWLRVKVAGSADAAGGDGTGGGVNREGIGAMVRAYARGKAGDPAALLASEPINTSYGFCSAQPPVAHLGLGEHTTCDLVITLPHGKGRIVREKVKTDQRVVIEVEE